MNTRRFFYNIFTNLFFVFTLVISCSSGGEEPDGGGGPVDPPSEIIPTNLSVNITIEGSSSENPNGDGSGLVKFSASATNAVSYSYRFGTGDSKTSTGAVEFTYTDIGTKTYNVKVIAYSSTNNFISVDKAVTVYVKPASEQTLLELLAGSSEKTWKIKQLKMHISLMVQLIKIILPGGKLTHFLNLTQDFMMMSTLLM